MDLYISAQLYRMTIVLKKFKIVCQEGRVGLGYVFCNLNVLSNCQSHLFSDYALALAVLPHTDISVLAATAIY